MKTIELTDEEIEAFAEIYFDQALYEYLSYDDGGQIIDDKYASLFNKIGLDVE